MNKVVLKEWLQSSASPEEVSRSVTGALLGISSLVVWIAQIKGWTYVASDWSVIAAQIGTGAGFIYLLFGLAMKVVIRFGSVKAPKQEQLPEQASTVQS